MIPWYSKIIDEDITVVMKVGSSYLNTLLPNLLYINVQSQKKMQE
ncbi:hypothetical protein JCM14036_24420 [Desulfotomaculum defluvii]